MKSIYLLRSSGQKRRLASSKNLLRRAALLCCLLLGTYVLTSCSAPGSQSQPITGKLRVTGSTALLPLAQEAGKLFEQQYPGTKIEVSGGGSGHGLDAVTAQQAEIGNSDIYANPAIYPDPNLTDHIVCVTPFEMITNPGITVPSLTQQQIIDIFSTGKINNWSQLGGPDLRITPIVRPSNSGTRATFRKYILGGRDEKGTLLTTDSSTTVRDTVAKTPGAIGYVAASYVANAIHTVEIDNQKGTVSTIASGKYNFWSYEHMYTLGGDDAALEAFLQFMLSSGVQQKAQEMGYVPINSMQTPGVASVSP
ncbi:phosphate ABC transporter substrate-binding protein [Ktedonobacter sp. SOSP1-52]|uniref:phosphate ABC transporter substrate-binding protein n=1 Tax=Ktedonobacter sp. SOSP1-52 TaxID=2778366 RepID=UPI001914F383|nr:phosphate ABC transporter substrate-binding protein [Ktedonobacter sp. SOSP1-52]